MERYKPIFEKVQIYSFHNITAHKQEVEEILRDFGVRKFETGPDHVSFKTEEKNIRDIIRMIKKIDKNQNIYMTGSNRAEVIWDSKRD